MGDHSVDAKKDAALGKRDAFRSNRAYAERVQALLLSANAKDKARLRVWADYFERYQSSPGALPLKNKIDKLESLILKKHAQRKEGYIDPPQGATKVFMIKGEAKCLVDVDQNDANNSFDLEPYFNKKYAADIHHAAKHTK